MNSSAGGSLADRIENNKKLGIAMSEGELTLLLLQLAEGLKYIHSLNLVHMDIKPGTVQYDLNEGIH